MRRPTFFGSLLVLTALGVGAYMSLKPWQHFRDQRGRRDAAVQDMEQAEAERVALMRQRARYESPAGREELARTRGYRRPAERPLEELK